MLAGIGAAVAIVASLGAVAVVIEQFTLRVRLRKTEEWAVCVLAYDPAGERATALTNIRLDATSRIVAGVLVPVRFFAEGVLLAVAVPASIVGVLQDDEISTGGAISLVFFALTALTLSTRRAIRHYLERCRIASEYRRGLTVTEGRRGMLEMMEGGLRVEYAFALGFSGGVCALASGVGLTLSGELVNGWPLFLIAAGGGVAYGVLDLLRTYAGKKHPMRA